MSSFDEDRKALAENPAYYNNLGALDAIFAHAKPRKPTLARVEPLTLTLRCSGRKPRSGIAPFGCLPNATASKKG